MPLSSDELAELRQDLSELRTSLGEQLDRIESDSAPVQLDQQMVGRLSRMDAMQQQQMARANQSHMRAHLSRVLLALKAIDEGDYGYCRDCDRDIGYPRLKIRPDSPLCVDCQSRNEM